MALGVDGAGGLQGRHQRLPLFVEVDSHVDGVLVVPLPVCLPLLGLGNHVVDPLLARVGLSFGELDVRPSQETAKVCFPNKFS